MQVHDSSTLNSARRFYSVQNQRQNIAQIKPVSRKEPPDFEESRKYYKELLEKAEPLPEDILTVNRINSLHKKNRATVTFLSRLYETLSEDNKSSNEEIKKITANYMAQLEKFAVDFRKD